MKNIDILITIISNIFLSLPLVFVFDSNQLIFTLFNLALRSHQIYHSIVLYLSLVFEVILIHQTIWFYSIASLQYFPYYTDEFSGILRSLSIIYLIVCDITRNLLSLLQILPSVNV